MTTLPEAAGAAPTDLSFAPRNATASTAVGAATSIALTSPVTVVPDTATGPAADRTAPDETAGLVTLTVEGDQPGAPVDVDTTALADATVQADVAPELNAPEADDFDFGVYARWDAPAPTVNADDTADEGRALGRVVTVFAPKGGAGKTTISTNLAVALNAGGANRVCLVDLDLEFGDVAIALKIAPNRTILDWVRASDLETADDRRDGAVTNYAPQMDCVLAPVSPADSEEVTPESVGALLRELRRHYDFVVVDTPPHLGEHVLEAMDLADAHIVLTTPEVTSLKNLRLALDMFDMLGYSRSIRSVVFNKADKSVGITADDATSILGIPVTVEIPSSSEVPASVNRGTPITLSLPQHPVAIAVRYLAEAGVTHGPITTGTPDGGRRGLKLRMRRK